MKKLNINQFDEKEEEITDALVSHCLGRTVARTLAYFNKGRFASARSQYCALRREVKAATL